MQNLNSSYWTHFTLVLITSDILTLQICNIENLGQGDEVSIHSDVIRPKYQNL